MNFTRQFRLMNKADREVTNTQDAQEKAEKELRVLIKETVGVCKPIVIAAIEEYNASKPSKLISTRDGELSISLYLDKKMIGARVTLRNSAGYQPDEEFSGGEVEKIASELRPLIEKRFHAARIPLGFLGISVPSDYYAK